MSTSELADRYLMQTGRRLPVTFVRGSGALLYDESGREYLDMVAGIAVNLLGHAHPQTTEHYVTLTSVVAAIRSHRDLSIKAQEADEILAATYLPERSHTEKRGHWA